jgi:hypothetical protein
MNKLKLSLTVITILNFIACVEGTANVEEARATTPDAGTEIVDTAASASPAAEEGKPVKKHAFYPSITAMIDSAGDYASDNGTFKIISNDPLHIQISNIAMPSQSIDELKKTAMHGIVYVAYDAFASTNIKEITITSVPIVYDGATSKNLGFVESARYTATIKKERARKVMQQRIGTSYFDDLLGNGEFLNSPSPAFEKLKSEDTIEEVLSQLMEK